MKSTTALGRATSALLAALLLADGAGAQDAVNGKRLYHDVGRLHGGD